MDLVKNVAVLVYNILWVGAELKSGCSTGDRCIIPHEYYINDGRSFSSQFR